MTLFHLAPQYGSTRDGTVEVDDDNDEERPQLFKAESMHTTTTAPSHCGSEDSPNDAPSNEYVLNVAFISFVSFMGIQAFFAIIANSQSMLADSEAMSVDALTYLFNMCAERIKKRPPTAEELMLPLAVREHRIEMKRLYLELIPPLISVSTLIVVTIMAVQNAWQTLFEEGGEDADVSAGLMLFFSGLNLGLDVLNVTCFARANQAYGLQATKDECCPPKTSEKAKLLDQDVANVTVMQRSTDRAPTDSLFEKLFGKVNLNMCSAWTHICADTMRSTAVLVAAGIAFAFDSVSPAVADSCAAIAVSVTILLSLIPLIRGLVVTAHQIIIESKNRPSFILETHGGTLYHV